MVLSVMLQSEDMLSLYGFTGTHLLEESKFVWHTIYKLCLYSFQKIRIESNGTVHPCVHVLRSRWCKVENGASFHIQYMAKKQPKIGTKSLQQQMKARDGRGSFKSTVHA